jgi:hypothetical protein
MCFDSMFSRPQSSNSEEFRKSSIIFDSETNVNTPAKLSQKSIEIEELQVPNVIRKRYNQWLDEWLVKVHHGGHFGKSMVATILPSSSNISSSRFKFDEENSVKIPEALTSKYDRELLVVPADMTSEINDGNFAMGKILYSPSKSRKSNSESKRSSRKDNDSVSKLRMTSSSSEISKSIQQQSGISQSVCEIPQTTTSSISSVHSSILHSVSPRSSHSVSPSTSFAHLSSLNIGTNHSAKIISSTNYLKYSKSPSSMSSSVSAMSPPPPSIGTLTSSMLSSRNKHIQHNYYHLSPRSSRRQQDENFSSLSP